MAGNFILSCESTVDLPYSMVSARDIPVLFYKYLVDDTEYVDDMGRDPGAMDRFYAMLADGKIPKTSQINTYGYIEYFEKLIGTNDVLHIAFGSGMSGSVRNAMAAAEELNARGGHTVMVIDSLCSSTGYGLLVDYAADLRDAGKTLQETADWVLANRNSVHHQFYSTDLTMYRRSGRMSGATAAVATILNICPIMRISDDGRIIAYDKVRGRKNAQKETLRTMLAHVRDGENYSGKCFICHSNLPDEAASLAEAVKKTFPNISGDVRICDIGTIIASHCGPGTVAVFFLGDERTPE